MKQSCSPSLGEQKKRPRGQGLVEYGIILALVAVAAIVAVNFFGDGLTDTFTAFVGDGEFAPPAIGPLGGDFTPLPPTVTPLHTNTPVGPPPTVDPNATETPSPTPSITPTPSQTPTETPDPSIPTNTPTPCPYGPHAVPGRIEMEAFNCGGQGVAYNDSDTVNTGGQLRPDEGVDIDTTTDSSGDYHVGWTLPGEWLRYDVNISDSAVYDLFIRYASTSSLGRLRLYVDGQDVTGAINLPNTNGFNNWATMTVPDIALSSGSRVIEVRFERGAVNYNYFELAETSTSVCFGVNTAVSPANSGTIALNPDPNCPGGLYTEGTQVTFTANPATNHLFSSWSGATTGTNNPIQLTINSETSITANFELECFTLTTSIVPPGAGTIGLNPPSNCGGDNGYTAGTEVTLTANVVGNYLFDNWSGGATGSTNPTAVTVNGNTAVAANFSAVMANCDNPTLPLFAQVNFQVEGATAVPEYLIDNGEAFGNRGNGFSYGWNVNNTGNARDRDNHPNQLYDTLNHMEQDGTFTWSMEVPNGTYEVCVMAGDPNHNDSTYRIAVEGTEIVNFNPTSGNRFGEGFGTVTVSDGQLDVTNSAGSSNNKINFIRLYSEAAVCYPVTTVINPSGSGTVQRSPASDANCPAQEYRAGTEVTFTAVPNSGFNFLNWSGASSSTNDEVTLTINSATTLNANFEPTPQLEVLTVSNVGTADWTTVPLQSTYNDLVAVCTLQYNSSMSDPAVVRMRNASGDSFQIRIQNPGDSETINGVTVHCIAMEVGEWTLSDGTRVEAQKYTSTVTDRKSRWNGETQAYLQSYTTPIVLGQVMSYNDPDWSVFWSRGNNTGNPPNASNLRTGKHVGEDDDTTRADELIGFIVVEAGHSTIGGFEFEAGISDDNVRGISDGAPFTSNFATPFSNTPQVGIATQGAMDGNDGSWSFLYGNNPLSTTEIALSADEDTIGDNERGHTDEEVFYWVFSNAGLIE